MSPFLSFEAFARCIGTTDEVLYVHIEEQLKEKFHKEMIKEKERPYILKRCTVFLFLFLSFNNC